MDLNEIIKHFTHNIVDLNENQWKVIEVSDIEEICKEYHKQQLILSGVVSSCVDKETLIEDLNDKRIVGKKIDENMWHYCRKETAEHLLDKYEIKTK